MARKISYQQAINEALAQEMRRDPSVFIMGEDVAGGAGAPGENDAWAGCWACCPSRARCAVCAYTTTPTMSPS